MTFQKRRIRKRRPFAFLEKIKPHLTRRRVAVLTAIALAVAGTIFAVPRLDILKFFSGVSGVLGRDLTTDEFGNINILLLGTGDKGHEGQDLTDSMVVMSLSPRKEMVNMLSIPRDLYVETADFPGNRINKIYEFALKKFNEDDRLALDFVSRNFSAVFGLDIPYAAKVNFSGFERIVDLIGGVDVFLETPLDDPFYPEEGSYGFDPFHLPAGAQRLDGEKALKYVRSRKTSSDFDRSRRQQQVLMALREKALEKKILTSPSKIKALYRAVADSVASNFDLREILSLAQVAADASRDRTFNWNLHDDPSRPGNFLYPPARELFGGAFVLLPASGRFEPVSRYMSLIFRAGDILNEQTEIQVLNGTRRVGLAGAVKSILHNYGFAPNGLGNATSNGVEKTTIHYKTAQKPATVDLLLEFIPAEVSSAVPAAYTEGELASEAPIVIELGNDFLPHFQNLDIFRNIVELNPATPEATQ